MAENITYFGELNGMSKAAIKERIRYLAQAFGMKTSSTSGSQTFKGMKQKAAFARSIVHDPDIMLFDEPTSGLDVTAARDVHDFILRCKEKARRSFSQAIR